MAKANGSTIEHGFEAPYFERLNYFYGQMLGVDDFCTEQSYFREKMKLHNRCLHGYGTVCGLRVLVPEPTPGCETHREKPWVYIEPGLALDAEGNELIVRECETSLRIDLWEALSARMISRPSRRSSAMTRTRGIASRFMCVCIIALVPSA